MYENKSYSDQGGTKEIISTLESNLLFQCVSKYARPAPRISWLLNNTPLVSNPLQKQAHAPNKDFPGIIRGSENSPGVKNFAVANSIEEVITPGTKSGEEKLEAAISRLLISTKMLSNRPKLACITTHPALPHNFNTTLDLNILRMLLGPFKFEGC